MESFWYWCVGPDFEDQRTSQWLFLDIRVPISISVLYLLVVYFGTRWMQSRPAVKVKPFVIIHNLFLFSLSVYMCMEALHQASIEFDWKESGDWICPTIKKDSKFTEAGYKLARVLWIHYISKAYEFVDTVIMILKKNTRQITFLHVYHHATTFFPVWWSVLVYGPGGAAYFCCALNSFVHIWMYGYYFLASLGFKLSIMKPFVTYSQMVQFLVYIWQASYMVITDCYQPRLTVLFLLFQSTVFFILFSNFAYKTYWKGKVKSV